MQEKSSKRTVTVEEAARILGIGRSAAYEGVHTGYIPAVRVSPRRLVVPIAALEAMLGSAGAKK